MAKNIIIISAGKFGRESYAVVSDAIAAGAPWRIKGFLDNRTNQLNGFNYPVGIISSVENYTPAEDDLFVCAVGMPKERRHYGEQMIRKGGKFATVVHPTAIVGPNARLGPGVIISAFVGISPDVSVGDFTCIGSYSVLSHDDQIGNWCQLSPHCNLGGNVTVGESCFFGLSATVIPGISIGKGAYIGAGSVVLRKVRDGVKVFGNPAVEID